MKRNIKKITAIALSGAMVLGLAACGSGSGNESASTEGNAHELS